MASKKRKVVAFDLESIADPTCLAFLPEVKAKGNLKNPELIEKDIKEKQDKQIAEMGLNPLMNLICCAGWCDENGPQSIFIDKATHEAEKELLIKFWDVLAQYDTFVTFNGRSFDLRCMHLHGITHGIRPAVDIDKGRYNHGNHVDMREILAGPGPFVKGQLTFFTRKYVGQSKFDWISGEKVQSFWDLGLIEDIVEYNEDETGLMFRLYKKIEIAGLLG